ncbi:hypothetical protein B4914_14240 [Yersinia entomophaga]|nr:hypothetical protein B4914_14240 [Yersinia entomophaga]
MVLAQVGFVSGELQVIGGHGLCAASMGAVCASFGAPLMVHEAENPWGNTHYLVVWEEVIITSLENAYIYAVEKSG